MIVCSCNLLSDGDVKACLKPGPGCPRTPAQVYTCLGCSPNCGRCARTIRSIMDKALSEAAEATCQRGCCSLSAANGAASSVGAAIAAEPSL
ncbi:(2Fe-2S)-binding protein [Microvirga pudoricolor]|uniref:(2Fe-2S)-binding protein n=1 Tax=Microvirga pudoricolor TaxID=2778729 RepID=UPI001951B7A4|nr:(2Fe-2S)-binding protein [Microvirga pudoricolor]MBM6596568.1 (2Fe-2S)-binding protein [Microvirga pudoricolor]